MLRSANRALSVLVLTTFALAALSGLVTTDTAEAQSPSQDFRVVEVVSGLENVWSMAFLPSGDLLVTERPGRLRLVRRGKLIDAPVEGVPDVHAQGQGGLLDVALHPDFETNRMVYLSYSKPVGDNSTTAVARGVLEGLAGAAADDAAAGDIGRVRLTGVEDIFVAESRGRGHYGSRLVFDGNGYLFISIGDRQAPPRGDLEAHPAQDLSNHHGTVVRIHDDGRIPQDNPFVGTPGAQPEIWTYGHRNAQGMALDPETGNLWLNEHGPQGGDELNLVVGGRNYGWPVIGYGVNYGGSHLHDETHREGMEQPVHYWVPSIATSGLLIYTGAAFPEWQGDFFVGGLAGQQIAHLDMNGREVVSEETLLSGEGRVRHLVEDAEGRIYVAFDRPRGGVSIVRLEP